MVYDFFLKKLIPATVLSVLAYLSSDHWQNVFFGGTVLVLYFLFVSTKTEQVLTSFFGFTKHLGIRILAIFLSLITLGWFLGIFIFFNYFNGLAVFLSFFANALVWFLIIIKPTDDLKNAEEYKEEAVPKNFYTKVGVIFYFFLVICGFYLLMKSKAGGLVLSPWQIIDSSYVLVFLVATFLLGSLIAFSKLSPKTLLFFVIVHSFLLHSYLPLTHQLFYGADGWRHIATEQRLIDGKQFLEAKISGSDNSVNFKSKIGIFSYANFWGTNAVFSKMLQVDLISLTKWFLPIVWSVIFTILLYEFGWTFGWSGKNSLLFAWSGGWPFALQAAGAFSLPVNFGFLIFSLILLLLFKRTRETNTEQKYILLFLGFGLGLGYLLFFILFWLSWGIVVVIKTGKKLIIIPSLIFAALVLPVLELMAKFSFFDLKINIFSQIKQFFGNIFALYLASGPRPHDIAGGNILFNQIPAQIFIPNFLTQFRWWLPAVVLAAVIFIIFGIRKNKDLIYKSVLAIFVILLTSYFLSFYLLTGEHLLSRRLDSVLAFLFLILVFYGLKDVLNKKYLVGLFIIIFSLGITASYTLGPDTFTVKTSELQASKYVWSQEKNNSIHCALGDTYPLLALEAVSAKEIIGGGFPIDANFAQPERVSLYKQMNISINDELLKNISTVTQADHCWFIGEKNNFVKQGILKDDAYKMFGDMAVIKYNIKF